MSLDLALRGVLLLLLGLLVVLSNWSPTKRREGKPTRKISWAFILAVAVGLACIALLRSTDSYEFRTEWNLVGAAVIPACVIFSSVFAVSFWEPIIMPWVLYFVPRILHFMPVSREFQPLEYLAVFAVVSLLTAAPGCLALSLSRRFRSGRWSWSIVRGLGWGMPCAVGTMFAFRSKVSTDIAFRDDYTLVWVMLAEVVLVTAVAGLKRTRQVAPPDLQQEGPTVGEPPAQVAVQDSSRPSTQESTPGGDILAVPRERTHLDVTSLSAPSDWRSIRNYSDLFPVGRGINYPAGVAFALAAFLIVFVQSVVHLEWSSIGQTLGQLPGGLVRALLEGVLFVLVCHWVRQAWLLPVVWGVVSETIGFVTIVLLGGSVEWVAGVSLHPVMAAALFMAGLVCAVQARGPGPGSLITGSVLSAVPLWLYQLVVPMPGFSFVTLLVSRVVFGLFLYLGVRRYFEGAKP